MEFDHYIKEQAERIATLELDWNIVVAYLAALMAVGFIAVCLI